MVKRRSPHSSITNKPAGNVRIIAGLWRGRKLPVYDAEGLRPTTDRVKETLFNWLAQHLPMSRCLDLFSGSGSLGFEAASRQANQVTMIELNPQAYQQLQKNRDTLNANNIDIIHTNALDFLSNQGTPYDIVFIDPPFRKELIHTTLDYLENHNWITEDSLIYIESEKEWDGSDIPASWELYREKYAGQVCYRLFIKR